MVPREARDTRDKRFGTRNPEVADDLRSSHADSGRVSNQKVHDRLAHNRDPQEFALLSHSLQYCLALRRYFGNMFP